MQSVEEFVKTKLFTTASYSHSDVELLDAFPQSRFDGPLDKNYVAAAYNFDDGGAPAEMGSPLMRRVYTVTFYVFGINSVWGENLANVVKAAIETDGLISLRDYGVSEPAAVIDALVVRSVTASRQFVRNPNPWEEAIWTVTARLEDEYMPTFAT